MKPVTLIYVFRDRDIQRVRRSLDSLRAQDHQDFRALFIDYGSSESFRKEVERLVGGYPFCRYVYSDTRGMPWNRAHAINTGIRLCETDYFFTADIDFVFRKNFTAVVAGLAAPDRAFFFRVGYLPAGFNAWHRLGEQRVPVSADTALGLALLPVQRVAALRGYDEFYCYWGIEDNDMHMRLQHAGLHTGFYDEELLVYHQHHAPAVSSPARLPRGWVFFQQDYRRDRHTEGVRNMHGGWGALPDAGRRKALHRLSDPLDTFVELDGTRPFHFFKLTTLLAEAQSGESLAVVFTCRRYEAHAKTTMARFAVWLQRLCRGLRLPLEIQSKYRHVFQNAYEARDVAILFILSNRPLIADYAIDLDSGQCRVVICKS